MLRKLGIEPGEGRVFAWGAAALFLLGWSDVSFKNVSETLFVKRVGVEHMPLAWLVSSLLLVLTTWAFGALAARVDRLVLLPRTLLCLSFAMLPLWALVRADVGPVFPVLVVAEKQITSIALIVFVIALGDLLHGRQAKRLVAPMMAGVTVGTILGSFASGPLGSWLGIDALIPVTGVALGLGAATTLPLRGLRPRLELGSAAARIRAARAEPAGPAPRPQDLWRRSVLFRLLLLTAVCSGLLGPMLYFQFQWVANAATAGANGEERLLAFYSQFRGWIYGAVLIAQLVLVGPLYRRIGVPLAAALSPLLYLFGFLGLAWRLSLPAGVGAMAGTKLQDNAVYDPALRVLYSLFPESIRSHATALLEGPLKRAGGALGNAITIAVVQLGSARSVGLLAVPIAAGWLAVSLLLWRWYPRLLLSASVDRHRRREALEGATLLDPVTLRALIPELCSSDPARVAAAADLVSEAEPARAVAALAEAVGRAPTATRGLLVASLDRVLEKGVAEPVPIAGAARHLEPLLAAPEGLSDRDRADLVQAYGRLLAGEPAVAALTRALDDASPAVRLAARSALARRGAGDGPPLDEALAQALGGEDAAARRTAREELRALLLQDAGDVAWDKRLELLADALLRLPDRAETAEALAEVAARQGTRAAPVRESVLALRADPEPRVRAALLRYAGHAGLRDQVTWLVEHVGSSRAEWALAARDALCALGPEIANSLVRELAFGKRSKREGILEVMRQLDVNPDALRSLYQGELAAIEADLSRRHALHDRPPFALLVQRLDERVREQIHTALLFLAAIRREDRIGELADRFQQAAGQRRQHAIVLEALESLLPPAERERLVPLLEDPDVGAIARSASRRRAPPAPEVVLHELIRDPDELTRSIAAGVSVAAGVELDEPSDVDAVEKALHLKALPLFEGLTTRQLMDLARVVEERTLAADAVVVTQGEIDDNLYLVVEGVVHIRRGDTLLAEMGPGDFFGEIALFEGVARSATAVTRTRTRLLGLQRGDLVRLIEEMPGIAISLLQTLSRRVRELTDRLMV
jgi:hypothetical protein